MIAAAAAVGEPYPPVTGDVARLRNTKEGDRKGGGGDINRREVRLPSFRENKKKESVTSLPLLVASPY
jgi:hypothetical protein